MRTMTQQNRDTIERFAREAFNEGNLDVADEVYSPTYVYHGGGSPEERTPEEVKRFVGLYRSAFPDLHTTVEDTISEGETVAYRWTARGTHEGELMGIAPTRREVEIIGITIARFADGKIVEEWNQFDQLGMLQQVGAIPAPEQAEA
jgi:steroid delta-isomerase-like uncharacterized protein